MSETCAPRCYEVRCVNGITMGNLTSTGATTNITLEQLEPVYKQTLNQNQTSLVDDLMRHFPGNVGDSANLLDVQCWDPPHNQASHQYTATWIFVTMCLSCCMNYMKRLQAGSHSVQAAVLCCLIWSHCIRFKQ